jgi:3-deoxy-D-manno-octulosonic-acid transferase
VPRKPERFDEVAQQIAQAGFEFVRYSKIKAEQTRLTDKPPVILGDTMGDLTKFYSMATVVFVGRSLVPMGGSDMMESAALGKCTIFGPHTFNFKHTVDVLLKGEGAIRINNEDELFETVQKCLSDTAYAQQIAANGREVIKQNQGATSRTVKAIMSLLQG